MLEQTAGDQDFSDDLAEEGLALETVLPAALGDANAADSEDGGSSGAVAGAIVGAIALCGIAGFVALYVKRRRGSAAADDTARKLNEAELNEFGEHTPVGTAYKGDDSASTPQSATAVRGSRAARLSRRARSDAGVRLHQHLSMEQWQPRSLCQAPRLCRAHPAPFPSPAAPRAPTRALPLMRCDP